MTIFKDHQFISLGLVTVVMLIILYIFTQKNKKKKILKFTSAELFPRLAPNHSTRRNWTKFGLFCSGILVLFFALARPQWGFEKKQAEANEFDVMITLDVSAAMLARDVSPNRIEKAKSSIINHIDKLKGNQVGLIYFAGNAIKKSAPTEDHKTLVTTLNSLDIFKENESGGVGGDANMSSPIEEASTLFKSDDRNKFLIIISDGYDSIAGEGLKRAKKAKEEGVKIFTVGVGGAQAVPIPLDPLGNEPSSFIRDDENNLETSKCEARYLQDMALATGGEYYNLGAAGEGFSAVIDKLQSLGLKNSRTVSDEVPIERFKFLVTFALLILIIERLIPSSKLNLSKSVNLCIALLAFLLPSCSKQENIQLAEDLFAKGNYLEAANYYEMELNASAGIDDSTKAKLYLNAGLAHSKSNNDFLAIQCLQNAINFSVNSPDLQSKSLNELGNISYRKTNDWLDQQNVSEARRVWEEAIKYYESAFQLDGNLKASNNLSSLKRQIEERINSLVSEIKGVVWRDINGDGIPQKNENRLKAKVFWDKNNDGEHNASNEASLGTDPNGQFAFEWISSEYPVSMSIDSEIIEDNRSRQNFLVPVFPLPPPPLKINHVKNYTLSVKKPSQYNIFLSYRSAPLIKGNIWSDANGNGQQDSNETGYSRAKVFLDVDGNFQLDENESSFSPDNNGSFIFPVPPGQYSVCILPENPDANVTFPIEDRKAYLTYIDYESASEPLNFGIQDNSENQQESSSDNNQNQQPTPRQDQSKSENEAEEQNKAVSPEQVNALYQRLLQEGDANSQLLNEGKQKAGRIIRLPLRK
jgi:Ca-activated chloride channel family protein